MRQLLRTSGTKKQSGMNQVSRTTGSLGKSGKQPDRPHIHKGREDLGRGIGCTPPPLPLEEIAAATMASPPHARASAPCPSGVFDVAAKMKMMRLVLASVSGITGSRPTTKCSTLDLSSHLSNLSPYLPREVVSPELRMSEEFQKCDHEARRAESGCDYYKCTLCTLLCSVCVTAINLELDFNVCYRCCALMNSSVVC